jgi:hypothetical protein
MSRRTDGVPTFPANSPPSLRRLRQKLFSDDAIEIHKLDNAACVPTLIPAKVAGNAHLLWHAASPFKVTAQIWADDDCRAHVHITFEEELRLRAPLKR